MHVFPLRPPKKANQGKSTTAGAGTPMASNDATGGPMATSVVASSTVAAPGPATSGEPCFSVIVPGEATSSSVSAATVVPTMAMAPEARGEGAKAGGGGAGVESLAASCPTREYQPRRFHTKSRWGCKRCREKRVKCDMERPKCRRCRIRNAICDYPTPGPSGASDPGASRVVRDMQVARRSGVGGSCIRQPLWPGAREPLVIASSMAEYPANATPGMVLLHHWASFTSAGMTATSAAVNVYAMPTIDIALEYPFLMHALLAVSASHLRHLQPYATPPQSPIGGESSAVAMSRVSPHRVAEVAHWSMAVSSFQAVLSSPEAFPPRDVRSADAVLLANSFLNSLSFSFIESYAPSSSWVFSSDPHRLDWLAIQFGTKQMLYATKLFHDRSILLPVFVESQMIGGAENPETPGVRGIRIALRKLCGVRNARILHPPDASESACGAGDNKDDDDGDEGDSGDPNAKIPVSEEIVALNPYAEPLSFVIPCLTLTPTDDNLFRIVHFIGCIDEGDYFALLQRNDPRALLVFACWLAVLSRVRFWWCMHRPVRDCMAICQYLSMTEPNDGLIMTVLEGLRAEFGIDFWGEYAPPCPL